MALDLLIVLAYFGAVLWLALGGRRHPEASTEEYFLSGRRLPWYSVAFSTIATNIEGAHFLGMMGSAYLYGIAQANFEIGAVQGIWFAAFVFVPLYLRSRVVTVTQFIEAKLGRGIARLYSVSNVALFMTLYLGMALFWGAYATDLVFSEFTAWIHPDRFVRVALLVAGLGVFSAIYTGFGGLGAVVRTDILQFFLLLAGGIFLTVVALREAGGWAALRDAVPERMHLHLPADHPKLPWTHLFGLFFLNLNYWCANQTVLQRSLAARSLRHAQAGLLAGAAVKYLMGFIIVVPGVALAAILGDQLAGDPDQAFPWLVVHYLPTGVRGLILCALFASIMSTVDSTFNSAATLVSVDLLKGWWRPGLSDRGMVRAGRRTILLSLVTGVATGAALAWVKLRNPELAFTHTLNELRYYVNCGIVVLIVSAAFLVVRHRAAMAAAILVTVPLNLAAKLWWFPEMNYLLRAGLVIAAGLALAWAFAARGRWRAHPVEAAGRDLFWVGLALLASLVGVHVVLH